MRLGAAKELTLQRCEVGSGCGEHGAQPLHALQIDIQPVAQRHRQAGHEGHDLQEAFVEQVPTGGLVDRLDGALVRIALPLRAHDANRVVDLHKLAPKTELLLNMLPLAALVLQLRQKPR